MNFVHKALALTVLSLSAPLMAQTSDDSTDAAAPRTLEPYVGVMVGVQDFDNDQFNGGPPSGYRGWLAEGVAGVNYNMGKFFLGAEGSVAKGFDKDIDWEYGAAGRLGFRAGKDSLFFAKVGYQWTQFDESARPPVSTNVAFDGPTYGFGTEVSMADLGLARETSNVRLRAQIDTRGNFHSWRPMVGLVAKF